MTQPRKDRLQIPGQAGSDKTANISPACCGSEKRDLTKIKVERYKRYNIPHSIFVIDTHGIPPSGTDAQIIGHL